MPLSQFAQLNVQGSAPIAFTAMTGERPHHCQQNDTAINEHVTHVPGSTQPCYMCLIFLFAMPYILIIYRQTLDVETLSWWIMKRILDATFINIWCRSCPPNYLGKYSLDWLEGSNMTKSYVNLLLLDLQAQVCLS